MIRMLWPHRENIPSVGGLLNAGYLEIKERGADVVSVFVGLLEEINEDIRNQS